jgi:serine phosphatase RsbU (regulator of sigma subunit)
MGQLRSAVRALAGAGLGPEGVMRHLDTFVAQAAATRYATLAYAEVDPDAGTVAFAAAGHPPPVLFGPGGEPRLFQGGRSTPLGVTTPALPRSAATFAVAPGAGFALYTDGLVERRREPIDVGIERLRTALRDDPRAEPAALAERVLEAGLADDVCLLVFRRSG